MNISTLHKKKLSRFEAQMLADWVRKEKLMELPNGWIAFYRLTPKEINKKFPKLDLETIVREARLVVDVIPES